jgi:hypothetical protein
MPLYNGNVNIIEGGNSLLQLYNYPPVIQFVTTGSNRFVYNVKQNVFCGGMELQWCKDNTFPSGTITSSTMACTASALNPLTSYVGFTQDIGNFGTASWQDNGVYYIRVRGSNRVSFYPYLPTSSFSEYLQIQTNQSASCLANPAGNVNNISKMGGTIQQGSSSAFIPSQYNSSSYIWYNSRTDNPNGQYFPSTASVFIPSGSNAGLPIVQKIGNTAGIGLNTEKIHLSGSVVAIDMGVSTAPASNTGYSIGLSLTSIGSGSNNKLRVYTTSSAQPDGTGNTILFDVNATGIYPYGSGTPSVGGSFLGKHLFFSNAVANGTSTTVYLDGQPIGSFNGTNSANRFICFQEIGDDINPANPLKTAEVQLLSVRIADGAQNALSQSNTFNCLFK